MQTAIAVPVQHKKAHLKNEKLKEKDSGVVK
jgi:hypothetical protein